MTGQNQCGIALSHPLEAVADVLDGGQVGQPEVELVKDALLFNLLSYLSDRLLTQGNTVAALDELYLWLSNQIGRAHV